MIHNNKVYANADEKFVKTTILYQEYLNDGVLNSGMYLFHDEERTKPVLSTEIVSLFLNGFVIKNGYGDLTVPGSYLLETHEIKPCDGGTACNVVSECDELFHSVK